MAAKTYTVHELDTGISGNVTNVAVKKTYKEFDPTKKPGRGILVLRTQIINFDLLATSTGVALSASDTFQALNVYAGEIVIAAGINNITATTAAASYNLGFTGGVTDFFLDGSAANDITLPAATDGYFDGPFYCVTADTIDVLEAGGAQTCAGGVIEVWALIARLGVVAPARHGG
ncbi:MAG: hypothetical protein ACXABY_08530 [Candidatus Thorarchaeota archaeon]|jgi:hypothetical protein